MDCESRLGLGNAGGIARRLVVQTLRAYADGGPHLAAAIAFRVLFSIFPLVIVLAGVFAIVLNVTGLRADVVNAVVDNAPLTEEGRGSLETLLHGATGGLSGLGLVAVIALVWSASGMMGAIRYALNRVWRVADRRPYLRGKAFDVLLVFGAGLLVLLSLGVSIGTRMLSSYAAGALASAGLGAGGVTWALGFAGSAVLAFLAVAFLYRVVPAVRPSGRVVVASALLVAVAFAALQGLFALYLAHFGNYNAVYGSLGAVVAFVFFTYLGASLFLIGAFAAAVWPRARVRPVAAPADAPAPTVATQALQLLKDLVVEQDARGPSQARESDGFRSRTSRRFEWIFGRSSRDGGHSRPPLKRGV